MARVSREQELAQTFEGQFGEMSQDQIKDEIVRTLKMIQDHEENKKAEAKSWTDLIKDEKAKVQYLTECIDLSSILNRTY